MKRLQAAAAAVVFATALLVLVIGSCKSVATVAPSGAVLSLFANPAAVAPEGTAAVSVTLFEASGQPVPDGTRIDFTADRGTIEPATIETHGGFAEVTWRATAETGEATVTAVSGGVSATVKIAVGGSAATVVATAVPATLGVGGGTSTVTATVRDSAGRLAAGVGIVFTTDHGTLAAGGRIIPTGANGQASDVLTTTADARVTAKVSGGTATADALIDVAGTGATQLTVTATPASIGPGGGRADLQATALDAAMSPVASFPVAFTTTAGSLAVLGVVRTDGSGIARNSLTTDTTARVTASGPGATGSVTIAVGQPTPANVLVLLSVSPVKVDRALTQVTPTPAAACADPTSIDLTLTATVTAAGVPVEGALVLFSSSAPAGSRARVVGRFCELPGDAATLTGADGKARVHYSVAASEVATCDGIAVPCANSRCLSPTPCVTATPTPSPTPTPTFLLTNNCCCAVVFTARVGSVSASTSTVTILSERDCPTPGNKLCSCVF